MPTHLIRSLVHIRKTHLEAVATIGNFDGVHLGHQQLIAAVIQQAKAQAAPSLLITFEPYPFEFFEKKQPRTPRLTRLREKYEILTQMGLDLILLLPFNASFAQISANDFMREILERKLKLRHLIVGDDFRFGYKRLGDIDLLKSSDQIKVDVVKAILMGNERISSTRVRQKIAQNEFNAVKQLLGRPYRIRGRVQYGEQLGRTWGFPTINISLKRPLAAVSGIYLVYVHGLKATSLPGVASVGQRPTVGGTTDLLEVHLLNFNQDVYGQSVAVEFIEKLREEIHFPSIQALKDEIAQDVMSARQYFQKQGVL